MAIPDVKKAFEGMEFSSEEIKKMVTDIMEAASARGGMTGEEREKLLKILELEDELADIEIEAAEGALKALDEYDSEVTTALETAATELEAAGK